MTNNALIRPKPPQKNIRLPEVCILAATPGDLDFLRVTAGLNQSVSMLSSRVCYSEKSGFCAVGPFIGAPYAAILMENLATGGCERFVFWGWCGSVTTGLGIGDILIPENAYAGDGTSGHYLPAGQDRISASKSVSAGLKEGCRCTGLAFQAGPVWTMDAIYRETPQKIKKFQDKGAVAVDMEAAALFSVSSFLGKETAAILTVSDELSTMVWKPGFAFKRFRAVRKQVAKMLAVLLTDK